MRRLRTIAFACTVLGGPWTAAAAQVPGAPGLPNPSLENRIPAPLPPPPQPPIVNGPLAQSPPPGVYVPPRLNTSSDRATSCLHQGSAHGLRGRKLDAYARACSNAD
jgi:hypothetical protein